ETLKGEEIFQAAEAGDQACQRAIDQFFRSLALGIYNVQYAYDSELILIWCGISNRPDLIYIFYDQLETIIHSDDVAKITPTIDTCHFKQNDNMIGATYHFITKQEGKD